MSKEQINTFQKYRAAEDAQGNLAWAARLGQKALRQGPEAVARIDVEREMELSDEEKVLWRLIRLPRKYIDLEHAGVLETLRLRGFMRGLVAADVVDIVEGSEAKALLPAEVKRLRAEIAGKELARPKEPLRGRVYRPELEPKPTPSADDVEAAPPPASIPAPVQIDKVETKPQPRALSAEERTFKTEIERAAKESPKQNHYEFLGITKPTNDANVRAAYVRLAREYHPDRIAGGGLANDESVKSKVDSLFKRLGDAQAAVGTMDARAQYNRALEALGGGSGAATDGKKQRRPLEAKNAFTMAETFFKRRDLKQAEAHYRQAVNFDGEDPKLLTALAYCIWMNPDHPEDQRLAEAKKRLNEVINQYKLGDAAYKLGLLLRQTNDEGAAQRQFAAALRMDPEHTEAQREVRLAGMRQKAATEKKDPGLLGKLGFKKEGGKK